MGAKVIAVARGAEKASFLRSLGADIVLDSSAQQEQPPTASTSDRNAHPGSAAGKGKQSREPSLVPAIRKAAPKGESACIQPRLAIPDRGNDSGVDDQLACCNAMHVSICSMLFPGLFIGSVMAWEQGPALACVLKGCCMSDPASRKSEWE